MNRLWLATTADASIRAEGRTRRLVETGGPVFGYTDPASGDAVVALAYGPGPNARHRPRSLSPDRKATQAAIEEVHRRSDGRLSYLGEWHTHPGGASRPSQRDVRALATIASDAGVDVPEPLMLIVPTVILRRRVRVRTIAAYRGTANEKEVRSLQISVSQDAAVLGGDPVEAA